MFATSNRIYILMSSLCLAGYIWMTLNLFSIIKGETSICIFHNISGFPCPSCGVTRSIESIFKGNFLNAILINPLGYFALLILIILPFWLLYDFFSNKNSLYLFYIKTENKIKQTKPLAFLLILLIITNWIWNIYKGL